MSDGATWVVVPAAGRGARMEAACPKQYLPLNGKPLLAHTLERILAWPDLSGVVVALHPDDERFATLPQAVDPLLDTVIGGAERGDSVLSALRGLDDRAAPGDWVLVHDAARPCVPATEVQQLRATLAGDPVGGLLALPVADTVKRADAAQRVAATLERSELWLAQTPQMFRYRLLCDALEAALARGDAVTDEAAAMEAAGHQPRLVAGSAANIKVTRPADLGMAEHWLAQELTV